MIWTFKLKVDDLADFADVCGFEHRVEIDLDSDERHAVILLAVEQNCSVRL